MSTTTKNQSENITETEKAKKEGRHSLDKIAENVSKQNELLKLRYNLLLIREAYRVVHPSTKSMTPFFDVLDVDSDSYSCFLSEGYISKNNYKNIVDTLTECGIGKKYLSKTRATKIYSTPLLEEYFNEYIESTTVESKNEVLHDIQTELYNDWFRNKDKILTLVKIGRAHV